MNKIVELAIKNANDKLAKKQAGDRLKAAIDAIKNGAKNIWNNPNFQRNAGNTLVAGGLGTGTYFGSRALGNDKKTAAKHSALVGGGYLGGKTLYDYKDQLRDRLKGLFKKKTETTPYTKENLLKNSNAGKSPIKKTFTAEDLNKKDMMPKSTAKKTQSKNDVIPVNDAMTLHDQAVANKTYSKPPRYASQYDFRDKNNDLPEDDHNNQLPDYPW